jgi:hypothetical protein
MEEGEARMQGDPPCLTLEGWTLILFKATQYLKAKEELWKSKYFTVQKI